MKSHSKNRKPKERLPRHMYDEYNRYSTSSLNYIPTGIKRTHKPNDSLNPKTDILFIGLPNYGIAPHEKRTYWTLGIIAELRRELGMKKHTRTHDLRPWKAHGIQIMQCDGIHTYNILRKIRYERQVNMVVILVGADANKFRPATEDMPDHILVMYLDFPGINVVERIGRFYGSGVFKKASDHVGKSLNIWMIQ